MKYWKATSYEPVCPAPDVDLQEDEVRQKLHSKALRQLCIWQICHAFSEMLQCIFLWGIRSDGALPCLMTGCWWRATPGFTLSATEKKQASNKPGWREAEEVKLLWIFFLSLLSISIHNFCFVSCFQLLKCGEFVFIAVNWIPLGGILQFKDIALRSRLIYWLIMQRSLVATLQRNVNVLYLQLILNAAAWRLIKSKSRYLITPTLACLHWLPVKSTKTQTPESVPAVYSRSVS